jgi:uncharacterized protein
MDLFMNYQHDCARRRWVIGEPISKPGDYVEFRAEMDLIVGLSIARSTRWPPATRNHCTPVKVEIFEEHGS